MYYKRPNRVVQIGDECPIAWIIENQDLVCGRVCNILLEHVKYLKREVKRLHGTIKISKNKRAMHLKIPADPTVEGDLPAEVFLLENEYVGWDVKDVLSPAIPMRENSARSIIFEKNPKRSINLRSGR